MKNKIPVPNLIDPTVQKLLAEVKKHMSGYTTTYIMDKPLHWVLREACIMLGIPEIGVDGTIDGSTEFYHDISNLSMMTGPKQRMFEEQIEKIRRLSNESD